MENWVILAALAVIVGGLLLLWWRAGRVDADPHQDEYDEINHPRPAEPVKPAADGDFEGVKS